MKALPVTFKGARIAVLAAAALSLSACALNPLKKKDPEDNAVASQGQRISIVAFQQKLQPTKSLAGLGFYLPAPSPVTSWPVAGGPQGQTIENLAAASDFKVAWTKSIGVGSKAETQVVAQPVSDGQRIYTLDGEARVAAFDVNSGNQVWSVDLNPHIKRDKVGFGGGLALADDGKLYVTSGYRFIAALDAATGAKVWQKQTDTEFHAPPTLVGNDVVATDVDNQIFAFHRDTGEMDWTYQAIAEPARILRTGAPIASGNVVYAPFSSGELVAINAGTGDPLWDQVLAQSSRTNALSEIRDIAGRPVLYNGVVFAASHAGVFQAMNAKTGDPVWTVDADSINSPWAAGDVVYLVTLQGELLCVSRETGGIYWIQDLNAGIQKMKKGAFGLGREKLVGKLPIWTGPVLASNRLILVNSLGQAVAVDPKTGKKTDALNLGGAGYIAPIAVGDKLFVVTDDAKLVAIR